jgi:predicted dehydrogenase
MRVAFAGLGRAARLYHLPALGRMEAVTLVGAYDPLEGARSEWSRETGVDAYATFDELLERAAPDVVVVATPPTTHADLCVQALEGNAHVVVEKPFTETVAEAERVLAAASAAGRHVAVNHQFTESPIFRAVVDGARNGAYGRLAFAQAWQLMDLAPWDEPTPWRAGMARRTLLEGGVHLVYLLVAVFGETPVAVSAQHSAGLHEDPDADAVQLVTLEFSAGRLGQITIDRLCRGGTRYMELRADCERASLRASLGGRAVVQLGRKRAERTGVRVDFGAGGLAWAETGLKRTTLARSPRDMTERATESVLRAALTAFARGEEPPSSGRQAAEIIRVIEAAYESASTGARVVLEPSAELSAVRPRSRS